MTRIKVKTQGADLDRADRFPEPCQHFHIYHITGLDTRKALNVFLLG